MLERERVRERWRSRLEHGTSAHGWIRQTEIRLHQNGKNVISIFFCNFPNEVTTVKLWETFKTIARVVDIYVARRRLRNGQRFGFVRFEATSNLELLLRKSNEIWMGSYKLRCFKARQRMQFDVGHNYNRSSNQNLLRGNENLMSTIKCVWKEKDGRSYAEVLNGNQQKMIQKGQEGTKVQKNRDPKLSDWGIIKDLEIDSNMEELLNRSVVVKVSTSDMLNDLSSIVKIICGNIVEWKFIGGKEVILVCDKKETT